MSEMVILVDEQDQQIGVAEKMQAHQQGLLHRAFSVFIVRKRHASYEILLQQRKADKYHCGALWTNTCCSHPRINETIVSAAQRRLHEEMGLRIDLYPLQAFTYRAKFNNGLIEHEYDHVLIGDYANEEICINPHEVQNYKWITLENLVNSLQQEPEIYTPWLRPALRILQEHLETLHA